MPKLYFPYPSKTIYFPVHILVNSAVVVDSKYLTLAATTTEDFDAVFGINTRGAFFCCREAANRVVHSGGGRIICLTTSVLASLKSHMSVYAGSKAVVETMVKVMAKELKGTGITAAPGPVVTGMFYGGDERTVAASPLGRMRRVDDVLMPALERVLERMKPLCVGIEPLDV